MAEESRQREAEKLIEQAQSTPAIVEAMRAYERLSELTAVQVQNVPAQVQYGTGANE